MKCVSIAADYCFNLKFPPVWEDEHMYLLGCCPISKEVVMYSALELTNRFRAETGRVSESGLPLEVFPQRVQEIVM